MLAGRGEPRRPAPSGLAWSSYEPYLPPHPGLLAELDRGDARASFDDLMAARPDRREQLGRLLAGDGITLGTSDEDIQELNRWFDASVEADPDDGSRLAHRWYAVVDDVALFLGDVLVGRRPQLRWELCTRGKRDVAYHEHVVVGSTKVSNPRYNLDLDRLVTGHAHRVVAGLPVREDDFTTILDAAEASTSSVAGGDRGPGRPPRAGLPPDGGRA